MCVCIHTHTHTHTHTHIYSVYYHCFQGFPGGSNGEESACHAEDLGSIPGLGRSSGEGKGYPLQNSGLKNAMDCIVCGVTKSWTQLNDFHFTLQPAKGGQWIGQCPYPPFPLLARDLEQAAQVFVSSFAHLEKGVTCYRLPRAATCLGWMSPGT